MWSFDNFILLEIIIKNYLKIKGRAELWVDQVALESPPPQPVSRRAPFVTTSWRSGPRRRCARLANGRTRGWSKPKKRFSLKLCCTAWRRRRSSRSSTLWLWDSRQFSCSTEVKKDTQKKMIILQAYFRQNRDEVPDCLLAFATSGHKAMKTTA